MLIIKGEPMNIPVDEDLQKEIREQIAGLSEYYSGAAASKVELLELEVYLKNRFKALETKINLQLWLSGVGVFLLFLVMLLVGVR